MTSPVGKCRRKSAKHGGPSTTQICGGTVRRSFPDIWEMLHCVTRACLLAARTRADSCSHVTLRNSVEVRVGQTFPRCARHYKLVQPTLEGTMEALLIAPPARGGVSTLPYHFPHHLPIVGFQRCNLPAVAFPAPLPLSGGIGNNGSLPKCTTPSSTVKQDGTSEEMVRGEVRLSEQLASRTYRCGRWIFREHSAPRVRGEAGRKKVVRYLPQCHVRVPRWLVSD